MAQVSRLRAGVSLAVALFSCAASIAGCADGSSSRPDTGAGGELDSGAGTGDSGAHDAGVDAASDRDAGMLLPQRCNPEVEYFEDEFGRQAYCVFVATSGDDESGEGTVTAPYRTISHGIEVAVARGAATGRVHAVAVSRGTYEERVVLANGISVYGQFDAEDRWSRAEGNTTIVLSREIVEGRIEGVVAEEIGAPTVFEGFTIEAGPAPATSRDVDVYGVRVADCEPVLPELGGLVLRNLIVDASHGAAGSDGAVGADGEDGVQGTMGNAGGTSGPNPTPGGEGAVSICGVETIEATRGGAGGIGGGDGAMGCGTFESSATAGLPPPALLSCAGGAVGDACGCVGDPGMAGGTGNLCAVEAAAAGAAAMAAAVRGEVVDGVWLARPGDRGLDGAHGVGGSGGGGGGSGCNAVGWGPTGGGGGGGGSGGCAGLGGEGGRSGGSSFGLFASHATFAVPGCTFQSRLGGAGGAGAIGGAGGAGGPGGPGGSGGFSGGLGGAGQAGGGGGPGAGGPGGSSIAALLCESEVEGLELGALEEGTAGAGGAAAEGGVAGVAGVAARIIDDCSF